MKISGWGRYPVIDAEPLSNNYQIWKNPFVASGNFRSYGDAALAQHYLPQHRQNHMLSFDEQNGLLTCEAGVLFSEIIEAFLPRGWFLPVTPGTKYITVGGAIASDVHGKNHHAQGCFSQYLKSFVLLLPNHQYFICSPTENADLFHATCGGMGLTGIITQASFYLKPVSSQWISQTTIKTSNLAGTFEAFEAHQSAPYSVAWIDCLAQGEKLGRSLLMVGDFATDGDLAYQPPKTKLTIPFDFPTFTLNRWSVKAFNTLYYGKALQGVSQQKPHIDSFFYPLDVISQWNRIYGKKGFVQFQFILPKTVSFDGLTTILQRLKNLESFLAVLKLYGKENKNWLSFPMEGYSLALDFKANPTTVKLIQEVTNQVVALGGRIYLAKDALLTKEQFEQSYPNVDRFRKLRQELELDLYFQSLLSKRLAL
ncbi:FAD-binding protein [Candidatus Nitrosacidococcus sp. I8]|uniref:FAD-binding protein n=1 Tax=Candidatus Nitrosacidococcus sp. I8 TaxID=2942908 RepID=UPI0022270485|nr:FAD-binding oxidoreductase [Candidatus Nitrosacidococcus sp. I8]CAH9018251.1 Decaprenylphosphoryl-beta-D-ribose oxidase [Candidatus Nitrosacidococcus sp. I8]